METKMRYANISIRVSDLEESLAFFCAGLGLIEFERHDRESGGYSMVFLAAPQDLESAQETRSPFLALIHNWEREELSVGRGIGYVCFRVPDIYDAALRLVEMGYTAERAPWDGRRSVFHSPDDLPIELIQDGEPLPPREPWVSMK